VVDDTIIPLAEFAIFLPVIFTEHEIVDYENVHDTYLEENGLLEYNFFLEEEICDRMSVKVEKRRI